MEDTFYRYACRLPARFSTLSPLSAPDTGAFRGGLPACMRDYVSAEAAKAAEEAEKEEEARALRDRGMIRTDDVLKMTKEGLPTCNRECHLCMRKNCKFRKEC